MESVEGFCIDFAASLDVKGDLKALTLLHLWYVPHDVEATFAVFRGHGDIIALAVCALHDPFLNFELRWQNIVDVEVAQGGIAVVLEENQNLVSTLSAKWNGLLAGTEVATVVHDLDGGGRRRFSGANGPKALGTELNSSRGIDALVAR